MDSRGRGCHQGRRDGWGWASAAAKAVLFPHRGLPRDTTSNLAGLGTAQRNRQRERDREKERERRAELRVSSRFWV